MPVSNLVPLSLEQDILAKKKIALDLIAQGRSTDIGTISRLVGIQQHWGWLPPAVSLGFAQTGFHAASPEVRSAANLELSRRARTQQVNDDLANIKSGPRTVVPKIVKVEGTKAKIPSDVLLDANPNEDPRLLQKYGVTLDQWNNAKMQTFGHPSSGGVFGDVGDALGGIDLAYSAQRLLRGDAVGAIGGGGVETATPGDAGDTKIAGVNVTSGAKAVTRVGALAAQTLGEEAYGYVRQGAKGVQQLATGDFEGAFSTQQEPGTSPYEQSYGGQVLNQISRGEPVDIGSGYLPDPNSKAAQAAHEAQLRAGPTIGGHAFTLGRATAAGLNEAINAAGSPFGVQPNILEPDTVGFNIVSGGVDAAVAMKADPASQVLTDFSEGRAAAKMFAPSVASESGSSILDSALRATGSESTDLVHKPATWDALAANDPKEYLNEVGRTFGQQVAGQVNVASDYGKKLAVAGAGKNAYQAAGAWKGTRPFMAKTGITPDDWYSSPIGNTVVNRMASEGSASNVVRDFGVPAVAVNGDPIAARVAATSDPTEVFNILRPYFGADIKGPIKMPGGFAYGVRRGFSALPGGKTLERGFFGLMPDHYVDVQDKQSTFRNVDRYLQGSNIGLAERNVILDKYLNAVGPDETYQAVHLASEAVKAQLRAHGMTDKKEIERLGNLFPDAAEQARLYDLNQATRGERLRQGVVVDGTGHILPGPQLTTEALNSLIELPDPREIRRATSAFAPLVNSAPWKLTTGIGDSMLSFWRNAHLLRPGLGVRIVGDSQLSLAANGFDSLFTHPLNTVSAIIGGNLDKRWAQVMADPRWAGRAFIDGDLPFLKTIGKQVGKIPGSKEAANLLGNTVLAGVGKVSSKFIHPNMIFDATNHPMVSGYDDVEREIHGGFTAVEDPAKVALAGFHPVSRGDTSYSQGLAAELNRLGGDPRVRGIVSAPTPDAAKAWFYNGEGKELRLRYQGLADDINASNAARAQELGGGATAIPLDFKTREGSDKFVDDILARVQDTTAGNATLRQAIITGKLDDIPLTTGRLRTYNKNAVDRLDEMADAGLTPNAVKVRDTVRLTRAGFLSDRALKSKTLRAMFDHMVMLPDAELDRIPAYQQAYWKRASEYLPYVDSTTPIKVAGQTTTARDLIIKRAEENLPHDAQFSQVTGGNAQDWLNNIRNAPIDTGARKLTLDQFHTLTKSAAMDELPRVVHDLSTRSQFFDMTRLLFPFGDAFRRIMTRWVTTAWEHPNVLRRAQQGITAARSGGFFHIDPTTGQEVFTYPGTEWLTDKLIGVPIPLTGQVGGLSMIGEGLPGIGPAVTVPAQYFLPDNPSTEGISEILFPYGRQAQQGLRTDIASSFIPPSIDKIEQGLLGDYHDQKAYNTIVGSMMRYLNSTGEYDTRGIHGHDAAKETDRLMSDAKEKAKWFYVIRGAAQTTAPSAPTPEWQVQDKTGHLQIVDTIVNDYRDVQTKKGPDAALDWLVKNYGMDNVFIAQPFSKPVVYGVPVTREGHNWANEHGDVRTKYPNSYGFFAPQTDEQGKPLKFDITAFEDQFVRGERTSLSPEDYIKQANNRIGMWLYHKQRDNIVQSNGGDSIDSDQQAWLGRYKKALMAHFPGFNLIPYDDKKLPTTISELQAAAKDPTLAHQDATLGLRDYLEFRAQADKQAVEDGYGGQNVHGNAFAKARDEAPIRDWLRSAATAIIKRHPDFAPMWEQVLSHEMVSDVNVGGGGGGGGGSLSAGPSGPALTPASPQNTQAPIAIKTSSSSSSGNRIVLASAENDGRNLGKGQLGTLPGTTPGSAGAGSETVTPGQTENQPTVTGPVKGLSGPQLAMLQRLQSQHKGGDVTVSREHGRVIFHLPDGTRVPFKQRPVQA